MKFKEWWEEFTRHNIQTNRMYSYEEVDMMCKLSAMEAWLYQLDEIDKLNKFAGIDKTRIEEGLKKIKELREAK